MLSKLFKTIYYGLIIAVSIILSIILHPIFYIVWSLYNRRNIALWLTLSVLLFSVLLPIQYHNLFSDTYRSMSWNPASNPFIIYGLCLTLFFVPARFVALKQYGNSKYRYYMAIAIFITQFIWLLLPIVPIQLSMSTRYPLAQFVLLETGVFFWDLLVTWLYLKYPDDILARKLYQYVLNILEYVHDRSSR